MVYPIKDLAILDKAFEYLECKNDRDYMILFLGVNTGLRVSDFRGLNVFDVGDTHLRIITKKTGEHIDIPILPHVKKELDLYISKRPNNIYLFTPKGKDKPLSRQSIYTILKNIEIKFKLSPLGTHTLRKTFGYHFYMDRKDIATLMEIFGHKRERITLRYIGITQDRIDSQMNEWGGIKRKRLKVIKWMK